MKKGLPSTLNHTTFGLTGRKRWLLIAALGLLLLSATGAFSLALLHFQAHSRHGAALLSDSLNSAQQSAGLDPTTLVGNPAGWDTRLCAFRPSDQNCSGKYPVSPPHVAPSFGTKNGAGACIDGSSKVIENQVIMDGTGAAQGNLELWWLPTCHSYFAYVSFSYTPAQVTSAAIWIQTETYGWFQQLSQLPPQSNAVEQTGPLSGTTLASSEELGSQLYSPLIYAPSDTVSASIDLEVAGGISLGNSTCSYAAGVQQYCYA
jgi:hypothetical protein